MKAWQHQKSSQYGQIILIQAHLSMITVCQIKHNNILQVASRPNMEVQDILAFHPHMNVALVANMLTKHFCFLSHHVEHVFILSYSVFERNVGDVCTEVWLCVKYSMYLFCPVLIRGMVGLRSVQKSTMSWRNFRQIKLSGSRGSGPDIWLWNTFPSRVVPQGQEGAKMGIFKLIIFPQRVPGDNSCHVSYRKHEYTQSPSPVRKCHLFLLKYTRMDLKCWHDTNTLNCDRVKSGKIGHQVK